MTSAVPVAASGAARVRLTDRVPRLAAADLVGRLVPPARFGDARFETYAPDPRHPSQQAALEAVVTFAEAIGKPEPRRSKLRRRRTPADTTPALYLDGGFGVGKTHLLASLWHAAPQPSAFLSFAELTALIGRFGMDDAAAVFGSHRLLCIDEFELDDVAHTLMAVTFLRTLLGDGTRVACTSNTLPDRLGEGRFGADDFKREITAIAAHFDVVTIDGPDYRHRSSEPVLPMDAATFDVHVAGLDASVSVDDFDPLLAHLRRVHPVQYAALLDGLDAVCVRDVHRIENQGDALLWVQFVDEVYEAAIGFCASGVAVDAIFDPAYRHGGYRKKYGRAESRLSFMLA
ncbi:MAG: cell division protein ZapE [Acidimicrobiia bacterium]